MKVEVKFFARCREIVGVRYKEVEIEDGTRIQDLIKLFVEAYPELEKVRLLVSLNHAYADPTARLEEGDEIALFPPVSGG